MAGQDAGQPEAVGIVSLVHPFIGQWFGNVKPIFVSLLVVCVGAAAFVGGTMFGVKQGEQIFFLNTGLLDAEMARHNLASIDKGNIAEVKGLFHVGLAGGLDRQYWLLHYPYKILVPKSATAVHDHDQVFMARILAYVKDHPEALESSSSVQHLDLLPDSTDEQRAFKEWSKENAKEFDERVAWVLNYYKDQSPTH